MQNYVGLDWGGSAHALCVIDTSGKVVQALTSEHSAEGLSALLLQLKRIAPPAELSVAIERPNGLLVDTLVRAGHTVVPIHPNVLKASRSRYRAARSKSDPGDAYILADLLRTDGHRFEPLRPNSDELRALQALVRPAMTSSGSACALPTACVRCSMSSGRVATRSLPTWTARSRWPSSNAIRPRAARRD